MNNLFNLKNLIILILIIVAINLLNKKFGNNPVYWIIIGVVVLVMILKMVIDFKKF